MNTIMLFVARMAGALTRLEVRELAKGTWLGASAPRSLVMFELVEPAEVFFAAGRDVLVWRRSALGDELLRVLGIDLIPT